MTQAYKLWDELVPDKYRKSPVFFKEWLAINANTQLTLSGKDVYHTVNGRKVDGLSDQSLTGNI